MIETSVLYQIAARDPSDGGRREPTARQLRRFQAWALRSFGQQSWDAYTGDPWANVPE